MHGKCLRHGGNSTLINVKALSGFILTVLQASAWRPEAEVATIANAAPAKYVCQKSTNEVLHPWSEKYCAKTSGENSQMA